MKHIFNLKNLTRLSALFLAILMMFSMVACDAQSVLDEISGLIDQFLGDDEGSETGERFVPSASLDDIPPFGEDPYVNINEGQPDFTDEDLAKAVTSYEFYSELDELGRCGMTIASIGQDIMPTDDRGDIGSVKPTGWDSVQYDCVSGKYLYNRCHLIGYQLAGENANKQNLITGTRYLNIDGMLPFEDLVADYVKETGNHVLYRVTPIFGGDNLVAFGVQMEGYSIEDNGDGVCFNVFCYNNQPGVVIDYATGKSHLAE